jgi:hypothetical protein
MIEVVTQIRYENGTRHLPYTPFWIDSNNPAGRMKKAPARSREQTSASPTHPSSSQGAATPCTMNHGGRGHGRGRGRGRGLGARLAHGIATFFSMCQDISADVHELARRQQEIDDNLRCQSVSMDHPFASCSPDVPLHAPPPDINEWH